MTVEHPTEESPKAKVKAASFTCKYADELIYDWRFSPVPRAGAAPRGVGRSRR